VIGRQTIERGAYHFRFSVRISFKMPKKVKAPEPLSVGKVLLTVYERERERS
jgi:hypothetical protein